MCWVVAAPVVAGLCLGLVPTPPYTPAQPGLLRCSIVAVPSRLVPRAGDQIVDLVRRNEGLVDGRGDDSRCDGVDADVTVGQLDGQIVGEGVQPRLGHRVRAGGGGRDRLMGPHSADIDDRPAAAAGDHAADHGLGQEERRPVQVVVGVIGGQVVVEERYRTRQLPLRTRQPDRHHQQGLRPLGRGLRRRHRRRRHDRPARPRRRSPRPQRQQLPTQRPRPRPRSNRRDRRNMNRKVVNFHLPSTGQFSVAVDTGIGPCSRMNARSIN
jgi:hypothetical protein